MFCQRCGKPDGHCLNDYPSSQAILQQTIKAQLEQLALSKIGVESNRRRRAGSRPAGINPGLTKVNVPDFPAGMHPIDFKPMKFPKGAAVNIVFTLSSEYTDVINGLQERIFPYPQYRIADYRLSTADGAMIVEGTHFCEFPFNLTRGGKKPMACSL